MLYFLFDVRTVFECNSRGQFVLSSDYKKVLEYLEAYALKASIYFYDLEQDTKHIGIGGVQVKKGYVFDLLKENCHADRTSVSFPQFSEGQPTSLPTYNDLSATATIRSIDNSNLFLITDDQMPMSEEQKAAKFHYQAFVDTGILDKTALDSIRKKIKEVLEGGGSVDVFVDIDDSLFLLSYYLLTRDIILNGALINVLKEIQQEFPENENLKFKVLTSRMFPQKHIELAIYYIKSCLSQDSELQGRLNNFAEILLTNNTSPEKTLPIINDCLEFLTQIKDGDKTKHFDNLTTLKSTYQAKVSVDHIVSTLHEKHGFGIVLDHLSYTETLTSSISKAERMQQSQVDLRILFDDTPQELEECSEKDKIMVCRVWKQGALPLADIKAELEKRIANLQNHGDRPDITFAKPPATQPGPPIVAPRAVKPTKGLSFNFLNL